MFDLPENDCAKFATKKAMTHDRILRSGVEILAELGVHGATVDRVMQKAKLTVGGFYAHFRSKNHMIEEVILSSIRRQKAYLGTELSSAEASVQVREVIARYLDPKICDSKENTEILKKGGLSTLLSDVSRLDFSVRDIVATELLEMASHFGKLLEQVGLSNEESRKRAFQVMCLCIGGRALGLALAGTEVSHMVMEFVGTLALRLALGDESDHL